MTESYKFPTVGVVATSTDAFSRPLERLFRLNASRKVHARQAAAAGVVVSQPGFVLLRRILDQGPLPVGELARLADMDPAATGRQVRQLEQDGLVRRSQSRADGRVTVVRATPRGREVWRRMNEVGAHHMEDVLRTWSQADRAELARLLDKLVDDLRSVHYRDIAAEPEVRRREPPARGLASLGGGRRDGKATPASETQPRRSASPS